MAMDTIFAALTCYLLAVSCAVMQIEKFNITPTMTNLDLPSSMIPSAETEFVSHVNSADFVTDTSDLTENTTPFSSTTWNHNTSTNTTNGSTESSSPPQTSQSTANMTPSTNSTSLTTEKPGSLTPTLTVNTTPAMHTTEAFISTSDSALITTNSSHTAVTSHSPERFTPASGLNLSEKNITIIFGVILGVIVMSLVGFMFHKCNHKFQYLHQPLNNTDDMNTFAADEDTLVISGGLYDGHPIYDNVPPVSTEQSQFHLQFL